MTRLIRALRDDICENVRNSLFVNELAEIEKLRKDLSAKCFDKHIVTPDQYKIMKQLPGNFFRNETNIGIDLKKSGGKTMHQFLNFPEGRRTPAFCGRYANDVEIQDDELYMEFNSLNDEYGATIQKREDTVVEVRKILLSVNTINRLLEIWPEGKQFIPAYAFTQEVRGVPALLVANLNAVLMQAGVQFSSDNVAA